MYAFPGERRPDPEGAELGVLLDPPHGDVGLEVRLLDAPARVGPVFAAIHALRDPAPEGAVDSGTGRSQVGGYALDVPALGVQPHHRPASLAGLLDLAVGRKAADDAKRHRLFGQDPLDGAVVRAPAEPHVADGGDLVGAHRRVLGLEIHDKTPDGRRKTAAFGPFNREQRVDALGLEACDLAVRGPLGGARLLRPIRDRQAEERRRPDLLVGELLGPETQEFRLLPVVGRLDPPAAAFAIAHSVPPTAGATWCVVLSPRRTMFGLAATSGRGSSISRVPAIRVTAMCSVGRG